MSADGTTIAAAKPAREIRVVEDNGPNGFLLDTAKFEHLQRVASLMASVGLLPDHLLKGKDGAFSERQIVGNCFLIVNQALRWGLDPFAVAPETYVVSGKLGFQGKLIAALVNTRAGLAERLSYSFEGRGDALTVTVSGRFDGESEPRTVTLSVGQAKTSNKMWQTDPEQKLIYSAATKWARRHCPEVMLGVFTEDDLERIAEARSSTPNAAIETTANSVKEALSKKVVKTEALQEPVTPVTSASVATAPVEPVPTAPVKVVVPTLADINGAMNVRRLNQIADELHQADAAGIVNPDVHATLLDAIAAKKTEIGGAR